MQFQFGFDGETEMNENEFETVQHTAERLGVTVRAVQKWAASGRIPGAEKIGRTWFIPKNFSVLADTEMNRPAEDGEDISNGIPDVYQITPFRIAMPFLNSSYPVGDALKYIEAMPDEDDRNIAMGEYYMFSGRAEESARICEGYLDSHDPALRYSANLIYTFANLSRDHIHLTRFAIGNLQKQVRTGIGSNAPAKFQAIGIFTATAASVLLHIPVPQIPPLEDYMRLLPGGLKLYACYILAHKAYLEHDYSRCLAIADMGASLAPQAFPVALIYIHIVAAMALVNMKRVDEAKRRIDTAWKIAEPDGFIEPFAEHHGLLQGLIEIYFKNDYPADFKRIISITYAFSSGWRKIHNSDTNHDVADNLTTTEFTVAMLYDRGWSAQEIAVHMELSEHTVRGYIKTIYVKLGITNKDELRKYMLL